MLELKTPHGRLAPRHRVVWKAPPVGGALIDEQLPRYDYRDAYQTVVMRPPEQVYRALFALDFLELPVLRTLFAIRELPTRVARWLHHEQVTPPRHVGLKDLVQLGAFAIVAEREGREVVLGAVGQPWRADYGGVPIAPDQFARFAQPGHAKIAWSWTVKPLGSGQSLLITEWRTALTDAEARKHFRRYWAVVGAGVRMIARAGLARLKRQAERED